MAYQPNLPAGQAKAAQSAPVVLASDRAVQVQDEILNVLSEIQSMLAAIASTKGIAADLRTTIVGANLVSTTLGAVATSNLTGIGSAFNTPSAPMHTPTAAVPNWQNQTAVQSFVNNIVRS